MIRGMFCFEPCDVIVAGDLKDEDTLLKWLVAGKEADDEIEDINRNSLKKMIENQKFVAVYFCTFHKDAWHHVNDLIRNILRA